MRLCMWEAREILWAAFDTCAVYDLHVSVIIGTWLWALSVELECSGGVRELTSSILYARCLLLSYVRSALCLNVKKAMWLCLHQAEVAARTH